MIQESNYGANVGGSNSATRQSSLKRVFDIILDDSHPLWSGPLSMGIIFYGDESLDEIPSDVSTLPTAKPINKNIFQVPGIGEVVEVIEHISNDYYPDMGGDPKYTTAYYLPPVNIYNNVGSNAVPNTGVNTTNTPQDNATHNEPGNFSFQKEFRGKTLNSVQRKINQYLRDLGYTSGTNTRGAPTYSYIQEYTDTGRGKNKTRNYGDYVATLDDSKANRDALTKLGEYYFDHPNKRPVQAFEKDLIIQGNHGGGEGQYIRMSGTTPEGKNDWSNNVTDAPNDGNPTVGDPLIEMCVLDPQEQLSRIVLTSNQNLKTLKPTSMRVDSLNATYEPLPDPLDVIAKEPEITPVNITPETSSVNVDFSGLVETYTEPPYEPEPIPRTGDPVFDALDTAVEEGLLTYNELTFEEQSDWYEIETNQFYASDYLGWDLETRGVRIDSDTGVPEGFASAPEFGNAFPSISNLNVTPVNPAMVTASQYLIYPNLPGEMDISSPGVFPYNNSSYPRYNEYGAFRGVRNKSRRSTSDGPNPNQSWRYHYGVDIIGSYDLLAVCDGKIIHQNSFTCSDVQGADMACGGGYGNRIVLQMAHAPRWAVLYGHCRQNSNQFNNGDIVKKGDIIAKMGNSGGSFGTHLHFELLYDDSPNNSWPNLFSKDKKRNVQQIFTKLQAGNSWNSSVF